MGQVQKAVALTLVNEGYTHAATALRMEVCTRTIARLVDRAKNTPPHIIPKRKEGSSPPRKLSLRILANMRKSVKASPFQSARRLRQKMATSLGRVSVRTVQRRLQLDCGLPSRRPAKKPLLTAKMKEKRMKFARDHLAWTAADWANVMYSDESMFRCVRGTTNQMVRRPVGMRYRSRYTVATVKFSASVMVWACFSAKGRGGLFFLPPKVTMDGPRYVEVLRQHLFPFMRIHGCTQFLQDGAPCHRSKLCTAFLRDNASFGVVDWPGNSPDLNPIENVWNWMKNQLQEKDTGSVPKLIEAIKEMWCTEVTVNYLKTLSDGMPKRLQLVLEADGEMTKY